MIRLGGPRPGRGQALGGHIMVSDGIKATQIQARYSPLISSTWAASASRPANVLSAIKHAVARLNPRWGGHRPAGTPRLDAHSSAATPRADLTQRHRRCHFTYGAHAGSRPTGISAFRQFRSIKQPRKVIANPMDICKMFLDGLVASAVAVQFRALSIQPRAPRRRTPSRAGTNQFRSL